MSNTLAIRIYDQLLEDISQLYQTARQAQVTFCWEVGKRIVEVEQKGEIRAEYGSGLIAKLSEDLTKRFGFGFSPRNLARMRTLYLNEPILPALAKSELGWADHIELMPVKNKALRNRIKKEAVKEGLNSRGVRELVRKYTSNGNGRAVEPEKDLKPLVRPMDLRLWTYSQGQEVSGKRYEVSGRPISSGEAGTIDPNSHLPLTSYDQLDCGFFVTIAVTKEQANSAHITDNPSYTYCATIDRVVDGDTMLATIHLGFGVTVREKLRLRGIDCPELGTPEGDKAKRFVESLLPPGSLIVFKSHKCQDDKYGRFLADVFYKEGCNDPEEIIAEGEYLNQVLLDKGFAVRKQC